MAKVIFIGEGFLFGALFDEIREAGHEVAVSQRDYSTALQDIGATSTAPFKHTPEPPGPPYDLIILQTVGLPIGLEYVRGGLLDKANEYNAGLHVLRLLRTDPDLQWARNVPVLVTDAQEGLVTEEQILQVSPDNISFRQHESLWEEVKWILSRK